VARGGSGAARFAVVALALVVAALAVSAGWAWWSGRAGRGAGVRPVVSVQVLNGSGVSGIAARVASHLRDGGFRVVEVANADRQDYFATLVVARRADVGGAATVARYLGGLPLIRQAWSSELADVTVVIGDDRSRLRLDR
jgi:hypothetical protein